MYCSLVGFIELSILNHLYFVFAGAVVTGATTIGLGRAGGVGFTVGKGVLQIKGKIDARPIFTSFKSVPVVYVESAG